MAINFPNNPTVNTTFVDGDKTWVWDGTTWKSLAASSNNLAGFSGITITSPVAGQVLKWNGSTWVNSSLDNSANNLNPAPGDVTFAYSTGVNVSDPSAGNSSTQVSGAGTQADPFIMGAVVVDASTGKTNLTATSQEEIIIQGAAGQKIVWEPISDTNNQFDQPIGTVDANGQWKGRLFFNGEVHKNLTPNQSTTYIQDIKLGATSVYFRWKVTYWCNYSGWVTEEIYDDPGSIEVKFTNYMDSPCKYSCGTTGVLGKYYDASQFTYSRGADGYRFTNGGLIWTIYRCGHPHTNSCTDTGFYKNLWMLEFFQKPWKYTPGTWFSNLDDPTHTVNMPTVNNAFTGTYDSGRATSTGGTMSWNPDYATAGSPSGIKFLYNVALYDDNTGTESRAMIDGAWTAWVQHTANAWTTIGSAATQGSQSTLQHIETRAHSSAPNTLPGFYAVRFDSHANSKYGLGGAIVENKEEANPLYLDGFLPNEDEGTWYNVSEWGHWLGFQCLDSGWWGVAHYSCEEEYHWVTLDNVDYQQFPNTNTVSIGTITPYPLGYDLINGVKTVYASNNPTPFNYSNDGYADRNYFVYAWSTTSTGVTFDDATKREPEVTFDGNDPGTKTLTLTITSNESGITDSPASGSVEVNVLASYSNETIGTVTVTLTPHTYETIQGSTEIKEIYDCSATFDGTTSIPNYTWSVTDTLSPVAPVIDTPSANSTFITFQYDPNVQAQAGDRTVTCQITATDATDSPASGSEQVYIGMS